MKSRISLRRLIKKGRIVKTREGPFVYALSKKVVSWIKKYCKRIMVVGSIRRKEPNPVDIDIVIIPKNKKSKEKIEEILSKKGRKILGGEQKAFFNVEGVEVELYYTTLEEWGAALLAYSSRFGAGIGLRIIARAKGYKLNQHGLFDRKTGKRIAGRTEHEIYHALGRPWKPPEKR
jgi:DNA polymerase (family 10)